jgi:hypothetical protein
LLLAKNFISAATAYFRMIALQTAEADHPRVEIRIFA